MAKKEYPFMTGVPQELAEFVNKKLKAGAYRELTIEEMAEDDAEGRYFGDEGEDFVNWNFE